MLNLCKILIIASALLCAAFLVKFGLAAYENATWPDPPHGFAVDAAPQHIVGLYHVCPSAVKHHFCKTILHFFLLERGIHSCALI